MESPSEGGSGEFRVTAAATLLASFATLPLFLTGGLAVLMRADLGFGIGAIGVAGAIFVASSAASSVPGGKLTERIGPRRALYAATVMNGTCMLGIAGIARSWIVLAVLLALGGAANGITQPATNALIARGVSDGRQGVAFGIKRSSFSVGEVLAGLAVPLVAVNVGWRTAWVLASVGLALSTWAVPKSPAPGPAEANAPRRHVPRRGPLLTLAIAGGFGIGAVGAIQLYFVEAIVSKGLTVSTAGVLLATGGAVGVGTKLAVGLAQDRRGGDVFLVTAFLLGVGAVGFVVVGLGVGLVTAAIGTALAFGAGQGWTGLYMLGVVRMNPEEPGDATGRIEAGMSTGAVIGPLGFGFLVAAGSFTMAWLVGAAALVIANALVLVSRRSIGRMPAAGGRA